MTAAEFDAIVGGYHGDPFRVLGPHPVDSADGGTSWIVRAFLPQAKSAELLANGVAVPMDKLHHNGFFTAPLPTEPDSYQIRYDNYHGGQAVVDDPYRFWTVISEFDLHLHSEGNLAEAWKSLGSHPMVLDGVAGVLFAVWAPNAEFVSVTGDFNDWDARRHPMRLRTAGIWEIFLPAAREGQSYKYLVRGKADGHQQLKCDPFGFQSEVPPKTATVITRLEGYQWGDADWMERRAEGNLLNEPMSVYEVHLESWMRSPGGRSLTYRELAERLVGYVKDRNYTHIELLPIQEYPFSGSWGYQVTGYFAPTSRFGTPHDFMYFIDACHQAGIGVILDWVPAHFPRDAHGLARFDGTAVYEHADPRQGEQTDWGTLVFNYGRNEVRQFLISSALYWLKEYHIDGLRVDAVTSMLYLDFSRKPGEWLPNRYGGRENLDAIAFLRRFNELVHEVPGAVTIAEESTSFPGATRPVWAGGLGFTMKWNMGWMHDMFDYFKCDPIHRKYYHQKITFSLMYAFTENFVLPVSHDEVVHLKRSLIGKMPGDDWQRFANVRAFLAYMFTHPGKKLLFMGSDMGDPNEWDENSSMPWHLLGNGLNAALADYVRALNEFYRTEPALHEVDFDQSGFQWIDCSDTEKSIISFLRRGKKPEDEVVVVCNFTPVVRYAYDVGVPLPGFYAELFNSDAVGFGGSNQGNLGGVETLPWARHGYDQCVSITVPPLGVVIFKRVPEVEDAPESDIISTCDIGSSTGS